MVSLRGAALLVLLVLVASFHPVGAAEPEKPLGGVVYVVGGISGLDPLATSARWTMPLVGVNHEIREFEWTHGKCRFLRDLQDTRNVEKRATELATLIREQKDRDAQRPIYLIGHSAGAGVVLRAAEQLPPGSLERIVLLSPAVSQHYDLRPALRATRGEIVSFHSTYDRFILDLGTSLFGTVDRYYEPAAGAEGFQQPSKLSEADQQAYQRLVQVPYHISQVFAFQGGFHNSTTMPAFLAKQVAPWLTK